MMRTFLFTVMMALLLSGCDKPVTESMHVFTCDTFARGDGPNDQWSETGPETLVIFQTGIVGSLLGKKDFAKLDQRKIKRQIHDVDDELVIYHHSDSYRRVFVFNKFEGSGIFNQRITRENYVRFNLENCSPTKNLI